MKCLYSSSFHADGECEFVGMVTRDSVRDPVSDTNVIGDLIRVCRESVCQTGETGGIEKVRIAHPRLVCALPSWFEGELVSQGKKGERVLSGTRPESVAT